MSLTSFLTSLFTSIYLFSIKKLLCLWKTVVVSCDGTKVDIISRVSAKLKVARARFSVGFSVNFKVGFPKKLITMRETFQKTFKKY
jgi:hypothetical protein